MGRVFILLVASLSLAATPSLGANSKAAKAVQSAADAELGAISAPGDFDKAIANLTDLFEGVIAHAGTGEFDAVVEAAFALRLATQLSQTPPESRLALLELMREHDDLARTVAFLIDDRDDIAGVYRVLADLIESDDRTPRFAELASAIAVVHDTPVFRSINENTVTAPKPLETFRYFADRANRLAMNPKNVPAEVLIYVVDACASVDELDWALDTYKRTPHVGKCFFEIEYDYDHLYKGTPKKVTDAGDYSLPSIKQLGGVCADQAYYAITVGKAHGIPTAYVVARGAEFSHAWVGFLETTRSSATWNFDFGRYEAYQGLRGNILNPQTNERVPDAFVAMLARHVLEPKRDRHLAVALTDAATRLGGVRRAGAVEWPPPTPEGFDPRRASRARQATVESQLDLLEAGLRASPAHVQGWLVLASMAERGDLTFQHKRYWADVLDRLCGRDYPDFSVEILEPMIASVEDAKEQNRMWEWAAGKYRRRADLVSRVRFNQGELWKKESRPELAWESYQSVIEDFANDGPFVVDALRQAERLLQREKRAEFILPMYEDAWKKIDKPSGAVGPYTAYSNWFRVGRRYAELLRSGGDEARANSVSAKLGIGP